MAIMILIIADIDVLHLIVLQLDVLTVDFRLKIRKVLYKKGTF